MIPVEENNEAAQEETLENFIETAKNDLDAIRREVNEIDLLIQQSTNEVEKLTRKNASSTIKIQQMQGQLESMPRVDIRLAYENALDDQQRLFVMRGQLDKMQSDQNILIRYQKSLEQALRFLGVAKGVGGDSHGSSSAGQTVEMMIQAQESERQRLARQMHDGPAKH